MVKREYAKLGAVEYLPAENSIATANHKIEVEGLYGIDVFF